MKGFGHLPSGTGFLHCCVWVYAPPPPRVRGTTLMHVSRGQGCAFHHLASQNFAHLTGSCHHLLSQRNHRWLAPQQHFCPQESSKQPCAALQPAASLSNAPSALYFFPDPYRQPSALAAITPIPLMLYHTKAFSTQPGSPELPPIHILTAQVPWMV